MHDNSVQFKYGYRDVGDIGSFNCPKSRFISRRTTEANKPLPNALPIVIWNVHVFNNLLFVWFGFIHYSAFSAALDRNPGPGYDTLLLRMIPGDLLSACPHRQFHTLPVLLDSRAALPNSYPNALRAMQGGSLYHFYDGFWYDPTGRRTHDLPCERQTRYRLSQPDTVLLFVHPTLSCKVI